MGSRRPKAAPLNSLQLKSHVCLSGILNPLWGSHLMETYHMFRFQGLVWYILTLPEMAERQVGGEVWER